MEAPLTSPDDALVEPSIAASAAAAVSGPPPSSNAPGVSQEPLGQPGSDNRQPDQQVNEAKAFDERHKEPFTGLLFLGYLEDTFTIWGHTFRIATPSQMERIQLGQLHQPYAGTLASEIAYQTILVATYLREVDHERLPEPVVMDPTQNGVRDRFRWVADNLRSAVIDELFSRCLALDGQVRAVLGAMGEAQG
jgi:hypothetical protein